MKCKICNSATHKLLELLVLQKYQVAYYHCSTCEFIQTEQPYWLAEAYEHVITNLDIGLVERNLYLKENVPPMIDSFFPDAKHMIDYGGGYGLFVRLMRDKGYDFYRKDIYCENLFARYFDVTDTSYTRFDVLTTFEVFEHLGEPLMEIEKMFQLSDNIIFTTVLAPEDTAHFKNWWYVSPITGQHIAFYKIKTLQHIAQKFGKKLYSNGVNMHVFTDKAISSKTTDKVFGINNNSFVNRIKRRLPGIAAAGNARPSLLETDYKYIEKKLINHNT